MTNTEETPDPRPALFHAIKSACKVLSQVEAEHLSKESPCVEYDVEALGRHIVLVLTRLHQLGQGVSWLDLPDDIDLKPEDYSVASTKRSEEVVATWSDDRAYSTTRELPWGNVAGAEVLWPYVTEFVTHGWDLAAATGIKLEINDDVTFGALTAASYIPDAARSGPDAPFGPIVAVDAEAEVLTQLAGRMGRDIRRWSASTV